MCISLNVVLLYYQASAKNSKEEGIDKNVEAGKLFS